MQRKYTVHVFWIIINATGVYFSVVSFAALIRVVTAKETNFNVTYLN